MCSSYFCQLSRCDYFSWLLSLSRLPVLPSPAFFSLTSLHGSPYALTCFATTAWNRTQPSGQSKPRLHPNRPIKTALRVRGGPIRTVFTLPTPRGREGLFITRRKDGQWQVMRYRIATDRVYSSATCRICWSMDEVSRNRDHRVGNNGGLVGRALNL